jgi:hypothetical protein
MEMIMWKDGGTIGFSEVLDQFRLKVFEPTKLDWIE